MPEPFPHARDVAQETLLAAARTIAGFRETSSPSTWLYTIARSFCIKKRRRSRFAPAAVVSLEGEARCDAACESLKRVLSLCRGSASSEIPADLRQSVRAGIRAFLSQAGASGSR